MINKVNLKKTKKNSHLYSAMGELNWIESFVHNLNSVFLTQEHRSQHVAGESLQSGFYYVTSAKIERHFYLHQMAAKTQKQAADFTDLSECVCGGNPISTSDKTEKNYPAKA